MELKRAVVVEAVSDIAENLVVVHSKPVLKMGWVYCSRKVEIQGLVNQFLQTN
jgi:hypothetical protein